MKKLSIFSIISLLLLARSAFSDCKTHPMLKIWQHYQIMINETEFFLEPYTTSLYAIDLVRQGKNLKEVRDFIDWYFNHLNYPDKWGLTGTVYDYKFFCYGREKSTEDYDSADSYSAMFLVLLYEYDRRSSLKPLLEVKKKEIYDIAYIIVHLQGADGLVRAKPDSGEKFLMDNCEDYAGLKAFVDLAKSLGWQDIDYYGEIRNDIKEAILNRLYDSKRDNFFWVKDDKAKRVSRWNKIYPSALAQLFPIYYDIIEIDSTLSQKIWKEFNSRYTENDLESPEQKLFLKNLNQKILRYKSIKEAKK